MCLLFKNTHFQNSCIANTIEIYVRIKFTFGNKINKNNKIDKINNYWYGIKITIYRCFDFNYAYIGPSRLYYFV